MRTKELKNNKTMRTGVILAAIAIITLIALIMTFAKYASQGTGEDNARVAKWGLSVNENLDLKLFSSEYKDPKGQTITVDASDDASVVAPGTSQQAEVQLGTYSGQAPEVMYHFEPTLTITNLGSGEDLITKLNENDGFTWTLKVNDGNVETYNTTDAICTAVAALGQKDIAPNTYPTNFGPTDNPKITIGWAWDFKNGGDQSDTELGNLIAANDLTSMKVELGIKAYQCQGCSPTPTTVSISGKAVDSDNNGVDGATVTYTSASVNGSYKTETKDGGKYSMDVPVNTSGTLVAEKSGYTTQTKTITITTEPASYDFLNFDPISGYTATLTASPEAGGYFVDKDGNKITEVTNIPENATIKEGGNEINIYGEGGFEASITAKTNSGYYFTGWEGLPESGIVTGNLSVKANFVELKENTVEITRNEYVKIDFESKIDKIAAVCSHVNADGNHVLDLKDISFNVMQTVTIIDYGSGCEYDGWYISDKRIDDDIDVPLTGDCSIQARGKKTSFTVSFESDPEEGGSVFDGDGNTITEISGIGSESKIYKQGANGLYIYNTATSVESIYYAKANSDYNFNEWQGIPDSGAITEDITVTAAFEKQTPTGYTVTFNNDGNTKVDNKEEAFTVDNATIVNADGYMMYITKTDGDVKFSADAKTGYTFDGWYYTKDGVETKLEGELDTYEGMEITAKSYFSGYTASLEEDQSTNVEISTGSFPVDNAWKYTVEDNQLCVEAIDGTKSLATATGKEGYTFEGWYYSIDDGKKYTKIESGSGEQTLTAKIKFKPNSEESLNLKPIQNKLTDSDGNEYTVNFLPAFERDSCPADFYALKDGSYIQLATEDMENLAGDINEYGAENVYTNATDVTFYGTIDKTWDGTFTGASEGGDADGLTASMIYLLKDGGDEFVYKTVYGDYKDGVWQKSTEGNWDHGSDDEPQFGDVGYSSFCNAYNTDSFWLLSYCANLPWSSYACSDYEAYFWDCDGDSWGETLRENDGAVVLSKTF